MSVNGQPTLPALLSRAIARGRTPPASQAYRYVFYLLSATLIALAVAGVWRLARDVGKPFGGFIWVVDRDRGPRVATDTPLHWNGPKAGLEAGDRILSANDRDLWEFFASGLTEASVVEYVVESGGTRRAIAIPTQTFTWGDLLQTRGLPLLLGLSVMSLGGYLVYDKRHDYDAVLAWLLLASGALTVAQINGGVVATPYSSELTVPFWGFSLALLGSLILHFSFTFPQGTSWSRRLPKPERLTYAPGAALGLIYTLSLFEFAGLRAPPWFAAVFLWLLAATCGATAFGAVRAWSWRHDSLRLRPLLVMGTVWVIGLGTLLGLLLPVWTLRAPLVPANYALQVLFLFPLCLGLALMIVRASQQNLEPLPEALPAATDFEANVNFHPLTRGQVEILRLVAEGKTNRQVAAELYISENTVRTHLGEINKRLGTHSRTEAVAVARRMGLLP